jgi:hypothetical protein
MSFPTNINLYGGACSVGFDPDKDTILLKLEAPHDGPLLLATIRKDIGFKSVKRLVVNESFPEKISESMLLQNLAQFTSLEILMMGIPCDDQSKAEQTNLGVWKGDMERGGFAYRAVTTDDAVVQRNMNRKRRWRSLQNAINNAYKSSYVHWVRRPRLVVVRLVEEVEERAGVIRL